MKLFVDTANLEDIARALQGGFVRGITTNPSLLAKEPKSGYLEHMKRIVKIAESSGGDASLSIEVFTDGHCEMVRQAQQFWDELAYPNLAIKIHVSHRGQDNLGVIKELSGKGIAVNCTACVTPLQAMMAAAAGARYVSIFYNRVKDGGHEAAFASERHALLESRIVEPSDFDANTVVRETRQLLGADYPAEIIVGSVRSVLDIKQAGLAGAHIVTVPPKFFGPALQHYKTDQAVDQFFADFENWVSEEVGARQA
jgi:transaldolase